MSEKIARTYFEDSKVVNHYMLATQRVGLWVSEKRVCECYFNKDQTLMDLGCGTGRIAFGLEQLGFENLIAVDFSSNMIEQAQYIAESLNSAVKFLQGDARQLSFGDAEFDGIIFGFNGLMQIPGNDSRFKAMREVYRILKPGGYFIFTGHDRALFNQSKHWDKERTEWEKGEADPRKSDFGDVVKETDLGLLYIHSASVEEVDELIQEVGFEKTITALRSELGNESVETREFSDECRFWVLRKPE